MGDLICRSELLKHSYRVTAYDEAGFSTEYNAVPTEEIKNAPAVDAKPVVHGEWIKTRLAMEYLCSNCQSVVYAERNRKGEEVLFKFCPECGARMDGE